MTESPRLFLPEILTQLPEMIISFPIPNIPEIRQGDNIGRLIAKHMEKLGGIAEKDIFIVASKIVSKSEGQIIDLTKITPSEEAVRLYNQLGRKSPQLIQVILDNSQSYIIQNGIILAKHKLGFIITSAGVDSLDEHTAIVLPEDPDASASIIRQNIEEITGKRVAIVISDSEGRPDREGAGAISIGVSGIDPLRVTRVKLDDGTEKITKETVSDMLAAQASLIMGQRGKNTPVVCIRGFQYDWNPDARLSLIIYK